MNVELVNKFLKTKANPNKITLLRIFLLPLPCALLFLESYSAKLTALGLGSLLGVTDYLDGVIARKYRKITPIGTLLDPIADKIFVTGVYLTLVYLNYFNFIPVFLIILREIFISYLRSWFTEEMKVAKIAKIKTVFQMSIAGFAVLLNLYFSFYFSYINYLLWGIVIFSYLSAIPYFYRVYKAIRKFKYSLKSFFISFYSLLYPLLLLITFPLAKNLFFINILGLCFYFFKKGLAKASPTWAHKESWFILAILIFVIFEYFYLKHLYFSLWGILLFSLYRDGFKSLKIMWNILRV
ncbi:MAG: CDP-diacylglycerol--glycerol-3-phosphate 3-phosphatidyltransferase [Thermodesulfobacteriota bacterium]|nr:MAG: CDP-diacylglycerol--glycerol-3-phosphate 3-phosphatidyltransferase [Thermodesulfobacteriota bacterium]RLG11666.1 MAG: CDP-diacylglycerol--glycerol-3-phosphate 3-phosphatidyltransferase [Candidatus Pacearchaeota archaeon]